MTSLWRGLHHGQALQTRRTRTLRHTSCCSMLLGGKDHPNYFGNEKTMLHTRACHRCSPVVSFGCRFYYGPCTWLHGIRFQCESQAKSCHKRDHAGKHINYNVCLNKTHQHYNNDRCQCHDDLDAHPCRSNLRNVKERLW